MSQLLEDFHRDGYALAEGLLTDAQIDAARKAVEWWMSQTQERYRWIRQRTYEQFKEHPIFVELIEHPLVLDIAGQIIGDDFHLIAAQCSRNTREDCYAPGAMKIHQDTVFFPKSGTVDHRSGFSAMWYVQDTPLEMGPTEIVRGSHTSGLTYKNDSLSHDELLRRPIPAGSLLLFFHRSWHRGAVNQTDQPRDLITNAYASREIGKVQLTSPVEDGDDRYVPCDELLNEGGDTLNMLLK